MGDERKIVAVIFLIDPPIKENIESFTILFLFFGINSFFISIIPKHCLIVNITVITENIRINQYKDIFLKNTNIFHSLNLNNFI